MYNKSLKENRYLKFVPKLVIWRMFLLKGFREQWTSCISIPAALVEILSLD
jgi:hypothetical protein